MMPHWLPSDEASGQPTTQKKKNTTGASSSSTSNTYAAGMSSSGSKFSSLFGRDKKKKKNDGGTVSLAAGGATVSDEAYMQINLQDLESYTNQILDSERARRRQTICRFLCTSIVVGFVVVGGHQRYQQYQASRHPKRVPIDYSKYPLTQCEKDLLRHNNNMSFFDLVQGYEFDSPVVLNDPSLHCRPSHPDCPWVNPTLPAPKMGLPQDVKDWNLATQANLDTVQQVLDNDMDLDVVLVGDSLVEHMTGKELGKEDTSLKRDEDVFETLFTRQGGGSIDGVALGIGGDRCHNVLYRLQNGELNFNFRPKVWWLVVGTRDWELGLAPQSVVAGIIRIVQEIRQIHPEASVVINSLLPRQKDQQRSIQQVNQMLGCYVHAQSLIDEDKMREKEETRVHISQDLQTNTTQTTKGSRKHHHHHRLLHFFNATNIFMEQNSDGTYKLNTAYMNIVGKNRDTPDAHGEWMWGEKIVDQVHQLLQQQAQEQLAQSMAKGGNNGFGGHNRRRRRKRRRRLRQLLHTQQQQQQQPQHQQSRRRGFLAQSSSVVSSLMEWLQ